MDLKGVNHEGVFCCFQKKICKELGRKAGFIKRKRAISAFRFLVMMTTGITGIPHLSLAAMVEAVELKISREALHERFTEFAFRFMKLCANFVMKHKLNAASIIRSKLLNHFNRIFIFDSTSWDIHPALRKIFPGSKGAASSANCKVQLCYEYLQGSISFFDIVPGTTSDNGYTSYLPDMLKPGDLLITDLGYFCLNTFKRIAESKAYFLSRFHAGTCLYDAQTLAPIDLCSVLNAIEAPTHEIDVFMGAEKHNRIGCRLICLRLSKELAEQHRRRHKQNARRKGRTVNPRYLFLSGWIVMITNAPSHWLPTNIVRPFYSLRWQIELIFKQLKSVLAIHHVTTKNKNRLYCHVLGKLIMAVILHKIHANLNIRLWNKKHQEISFDKLFKRFQERSFTLTDLLLQSLSKMLIYLQKELNKLLNTCRKLKQKSRFSTLEKLEILFCNHQKSFLT